LKILVVDDDVDLLKLMVRYLQTQGYDVKSAVSAADTLGLLSTESPEVVFLDLFLPDQSGLQLLAKIRDKNPSSSVVMMSGGNTTQSSVSAIRMGADDCLDKPFPLTEMKRLIEELSKAKLPQVDPVGNKMGTMPGALRVASYDDAEREIILKALEATRWNRTRTAEVLGISRRTVINKIHKWNLAPSGTSVCSRG